MPNWTRNPGGRLFRKVGSMIAASVTVTAALLGAHSAVDRFTAGATPQRAAKLAAAEDPCAALRWDSWHTPGSVTAEEAAAVQAGRWCGGDAHFDIVAAVLAADGDCEHLRWAVRAERITADQARWAETTLRPDCHRPTWPTPAWWHDYAAGLRACENGSSYASAPWHYYRGAYQFDLSTWASVGGYGDPAAADPAEQDYRAWLLWTARGPQPWPHCGRYLR